MKNLLKMQKEMKKMQEKMRLVKVVGDSKSGKVKVTMNGAQELEGVSIDSTILRPDLKHDIEKQIMEAYKDVQKKIKKQLSKNMNMDDIKSMLGQD